MVPGSIDGERQVKEFVQTVNHMKNSNSKYTPMILEKNESHLEYQDLDTAEHITISKDTMQWHVRPYQWKDVPDEEYRKRVVDAITRIVSSDNRDNPFFHDDSMGICEVTMNSILNTQDLIAEGKEIELPNWCQDLDAMKKRIETGDRIFCIELNQGGDGQNIGSIYALNGWDSDFNRYADVEVLGTWM